MNNNIIINRGENEGLFTLSADYTAGIIYHPAEYIPEENVMMPGTFTITLYTAPVWCPEENVTMPADAEESCVDELLQYVSEDQLFDMLETAVQLYVESTWAQYY